MSKVSESILIYPSKPKTVRFSNEIIYFIVPDNEEEDRMGTWHLDASRFKQRVADFEKKFMRDVKHN